MIGRDLSRLHASLNDIPRTKHEHIAIRCDVSSRKDSLDAAAQLAEAGEIHVLVNSAGITLNKLLLHTTAEDFDTILRTNLYGSVGTGSAEYLLGLTLPSVVHGSSCSATHVTTP